MALIPCALAESPRHDPPSLEVRYRLETVDQDGIDKNAVASTARARATWRSPTVAGFSVGVEGDAVFAVPPGAKERFNSTENGQVEYPVVADPTDADLNLAYLRYGNDALTVTAGRQRITHAGQRFVGGVAWRQNEQTYDALRVQSKHDKLALDYSYVINVNRIFGPGDGAQPGDWKGDSHLLRGSLSFAAHEFGAFAYLLDFENDNGPPNSTATYGMDYKGTYGPLSLVGGVAHQSDWADSPLSYDAMQYMLEVRAKTDFATFTGGYEVLESDAGVPFRTPLATLHKFQGWTDKFLATPALGVADAYLTVAGKVGPSTLTLAFHKLQAADGGADYGTEVGAMVSLPLRKRLSAMLKFAHYNADGYATDTTKFWLMLTYRI